MPKHYLPFVCFVLFSLTSCTTTYVVNSVNTPLLSEKGDTQVGVNYKVAELFVVTLEPEAAYAITDHIGVMYSGSYAFKNSSNIEPGDFYNKRSFSEIGIGYYNRFAPHFQYETYGGYGYGNIEERYKDQDDETIVYNAAKYNRYFAQPTIAYMSDSFRIAFTPRIVYIDYIRTNGSNSNFATVEPVFSMQVGRKLVFQMQVGVSLYSESFDGDYNPFLASIGLKYRFGTN